MKKILGILSILSLCFSFSLADDTIDGGTLGEVTVTAQGPSSTPITLDTPSAATPDIDAINQQMQQQREEGKLGTGASTSNKDSQKEQIAAVESNIDCMMGIGCQFNVYDMLGIQQKSTNKTERTSVLTFVQDVILAATFFIGTIVTLAFIFSGLLFVFSAADSSKKQKAISGMKYAAIGMVLVMGSYAIIRLIQYIAEG